MSESGTYYGILDNGGYSFVVKVLQDKVVVFDATVKEDNGSIRSTKHIQASEKPVETFHRISKVDGPQTFQLFHPWEITAKKIFVPKGEVKSYHDDGTRYNEQDDEYNGNSILIQTGERDYIYVGSEILSFTTPDEIQAYRSIVGNSAVPYPFATGTENVYKIIYGTFVPLANAKEEPYDDDKADKKFEFKKERGQA